MQDNNSNANKKPRILIIGTVPYKQSSPSRALDSFFHFWPKECVAQFFSNPARPFKGHCNTLFQIVDTELIKRRFKKNELGTIFLYDDLDYENAANKNEKRDNHLPLSYRIGKKRTPLTHLIRKIVWKKKYWFNTKFKKWLEDFNPECIFLCVSDDFFIQDIGLAISKKYTIPIICQIDDDYIFDRKKTINPFYHIYKHKYEKQFANVMKEKTTAVYICDRIKRAYNNKYNIDGETIYLSSEIERRIFKPIDKKDPKIVYFGSLRLDRYKSLIDISNALSEIDRNYKMEIYSNEKDPKFYKGFKKCKNIFFGGSIPYSDVIKKTSESDLLLIVEGFSKHAIRSTKYSLSTKIADAISSGANLFTYGTEESGAIDYLSTTNSSLICVKKEELVSKLSELINNQALQKMFYNNSLIASKNHTIETSSSAFERIVSKIVDRRID